MNKLKENIFGIAVGGTVLVLLAMVYLLVIEPLGTLGAKEAELEETIKKLEVFNDPKKTPILPTKSYADLLTDKKDAVQKSLDEGVKYYEDRAAAFRQYFQDSTTRPDAATFTGQYKDALTNAVKSYQEKFKLELQPDADPEQAVPRITLMDLSVPDDAKIEMAMKEYWIAKEILDACMELDIAGLQSIDFGGRTAEKTPHPYYRRMEVAVLAEMPFAKIENLLTRLHASKRVPFLLTSLEMKKKPEATAAFQALEKSVPFKKPEDAGKDPYSTLVPEPPAVVELKLAAIDWTGLKEPAAEDAKKTPEK